MLNVCLTIQCFLLTSAFLLFVTDSSSTRVENKALLLMLRDTAFSARRSKGFCGLLVEV